MHNVQELDLTFRSAGRSMIPWSMLYRTSLVTLKIRISCITELPSHFSLPCLKTFHLASIRFLNDDCTEETFLGCPVLRELVLLDCKWMSSQNIAISSSTLKSLTINDLLSFNPSYDSMISIFNPSYDPIGFIKIDATNLTYFEYSGYLSNKILFNNASSLVKACIHIPPSEWQNRVACRVVDLLKRLQHVVSLSVSNPTIEKGWIYGGLIPSYKIRRKQRLDGVVEIKPVATPSGKFTVDVHHGMVAKFASSKLQRPAYAVGKIENSNRENETTSIAPSKLKHTLWLLLTATPISGTPPPPTMCSKSKRLIMGKERSHKRHEVDINNLPDCILHHILSLMPTKEAVKTSILSTRWKNLWAFLPTIVLDDGLLMAKKVEDATSFVNFVERVLHLRGASNMEKLNLSCRVTTVNFQSPSQHVSYAIVNVI
ncbi:hypothetical protein LXL04_039781 [Taraxacum kok-saghyz]